MSRLTMQFKVPMAEAVQPRIRSDIRREYWEEVLGNFLGNQFGKGDDPTPSIEREEYEITLQLDLSDDSFYYEHNCGNLNLRDGILMAVLEKIRAGDVKDVSGEPR